MTYQRSTFAKPLSKLVDVIAYKSEIFGIENLDYAHKNYPNLTITSSHTSNMDFFVLNSVLTKQLGWENHPIFIYRDDLRAPFFFGKQFPKWTSTLIIETLGKSIPINQQAGKKGLKDIIPKLKDVFKEGKHPILFPGATRRHGLRNPLIKRSTELYSLYVDKLIKIEDHAHLPVYISHDKYEKVSVVNFGKPITNSNENEKSIGAVLWQSLADMACEDISDIVNDEDKQKKLTNDIRLLIRDNDRSVHD